MKKADQGLASAVYNQAALIASDLDLPDLAREMCHRHAAGYLDACPLPGMSAIRGLEPVVNLARLQIRAGHADDGRQRLLDLYKAVEHGHSSRFEGVTVPADLTTTDEDRQEVRAWLWRVLLADGTRTLTTEGRWPEALAHIEAHHGIGTADARRPPSRRTRRPRCGRHRTRRRTPRRHGTRRSVGTSRHGMPDRAVPPRRRAADRRPRGRPGDGYSTKPNRDDRLRHPPRTYSPRRDRPPTLRRAPHRRGSPQKDDGPLDGYAAREVLAHAPFSRLVTGNQAQGCRDLVRSCGLGSGALPDDLSTDLSAALDFSEAVISHSLSAATTPHAATDRAKLSCAVEGRARGYRAPELFWHVCGSGPVRTTAPTPPNSAASGGGWRAASTRDGGDRGRTALGRTGPGRTGRDRGPAVTGARHVSAGFEKGPRPDATDR